jgi:hypothetical protein
MSLTGLLFTIIVISAASLGLKAIINSRTMRIWLISRRENLNQIEVEKEQQKTRQRTLEEIKNPDRILEVILQIKRGEEVKIPLAAFDYIYRNMNRFSIVDKKGRVTIINEEDYFKFKQEAITLMNQASEERIDARKILADIADRVAKSPIEVNEHEDGTIVKIDHVSRTAEIIKPNGEKIFIDHQTDTMVTQNLIEHQEGKSSKKEQIIQEATIKKSNEHIKLLQGKLKKIEEEKEQIEQMPQKPIKIDNNITDMDIHYKNDGDDILLIAKLDKEKAHESKVVTPDVLPSPFVSKAQIPSMQQVIKKRAVLPTQEKKSNVENEQKCEYLSFDNLQSFLNRAIDFKSIPDFINFLTLPFEEKEAKRVKSALMCANVAFKSTEANNASLDSSCSTLNQPIGSISNESAFKLHNITPLCVLFDANISCCLLNIHWFFLKICAMLDNKGIESFLNQFYVEPKKSFVNNDALSQILTHINTKSIFAIGSKIFMQEENDNKIVNFKTIKAKKDTDNYQGQYLFMFTSNSCIKALVKGIEETMEERKITIDNEMADKGEKINLEFML